MVSYFCSVASKKTVLHIGCYEHDEKYLQSENWKHRLLCDKASRCVGVDINETGVNKMLSLGFEAVFADATSDFDIKEKFDIIIVGDVIEHVTNINGLIGFCRRHLRDDGSIIVSTPNPFYFGTVVQAWLNGPMVANFEHVSWISESNMLEICRRNSLNLVSAIYPTGYSTANHFFRLIKKLAFRIKSFFPFTTIVYVLSLADSKLPAVKN